MDLKPWIENVYNGLEQNHFGRLGEPETAIFDRPDIGIAAGDDPYFAFLKEHIGPFHWSPAEAFA